MGRNQAQTAFFGYRHLKRFIRDSLDRATDLADLVLEYTADKAVRVVQVSGEALAEAGEATEDDVAPEGDGK